MTETEQRFFTRVEQSDFSGELFLPPGLSHWKDGRYTLKRAERDAARTRIAGVRFLPADPEDRGPERQTQEDVAHLVQGVMHLRAVDGYGDVALSTETLRSRGRTKFGLARGVADDPEAARVSHRRIRRAVARAGLAVEHPRAFEPATGLEGLHAWATELRLRRRRRIPPWLLLLPLLLLLLLLDFDGAAEPERFFGVRVDTRSLIVLVDKSNSMAPHFPVVQAKAKNFLQRMLAAGDRHYANVIAYDSRATSALDGLREVTDATFSELARFLDGLRSGGGTNLRSGLERAARQVAAHEQPTTLVILTDGQDKSIRQMLAASPELLQQFDGVEIRGNALTPRLFGDTGDPAPRNDAERGLHDLATTLNGRFGPEQDT